MVMMMVVMTMIVRCEGGGDFGGDCDLLGGPPTL